PQPLLTLRTHHEVRDGAKAPQGVLDADILKVHVRLAGTHEQSRQLPGSVLDDHGHRGEGCCLTAVLARQTSAALHAAAQEFAHTCLIAGGQRLLESGDVLPEALEVDLYV